MLLIQRLLHYYDKMPNVELNIKDREKQLFKPTFRVFQNSRKALEELKLGINNYLSDNRKRRSNTFHAALYKIVTGLIKREQTIELKFTLISTSLKDELQGKNIPHKSMSFECADFGIIYQGNVSTTLQEVFGADPKRHTKGERYLKFNWKNLNKLSKIYEMPTEIKVRSIGSSGSSSTKNTTTTAKKSKIKSKNKQVTGKTVKTVSRDRHGIFSKSKMKNSQRNQAQKQSKNTKNNIENKSAYPISPSLLSRPSSSKNSQKIGKKQVIPSTK